MGLINYLKRKKGEIFTLNIFLSSTFLLLMTTLLLGMTFLILKVSSKRTRARDWKARENICIQYQFLLVSFDREPLLIYPRNGSRVLIRYRGRKGATEITRQSLL